MYKFKDISPESIKAVLVLCFLGIVRLLSHTTGRWWLTQCHPNHQLPILICISKEYAAESLKSETLLVFLQK